MAKLSSTGLIRQPSLGDSLAPLVILAALIAASLALFGLDALDGPIQVALILCCAARMTSGARESPSDG